jgi:hypothetical protein
MTEYLKQLKNKYYNMRYIIAISLIFLVIISCSDSGKRAIKKEARIRKEALAIAEKYAADKLTCRSKIVDLNRVIILGNDEKRYIIEPSRVLTGVINEDDETDAIVTITSLKGNFIDIIEHLIMISEEGNLRIIRSVESDMRVLTINDGIITAKVPTHSRNSPLYNCEACQEIKNYRFINGNLEEIK